MVDGLAHKNFNQCAGRVRANQTRYDERLERKEALPRPSLS